MADKEWRPHWKHRRGPMKGKSEAPYDAPQAPSGAPLPPSPARDASEAQRVAYAATLLESNVPPGVVMQALQRGPTECTYQEAETLIALAGQMWLDSRNMLTYEQRLALMDVQLQRVVRNCEVMADTRGQVAAMKERRALLFESHREATADAGGQMAEDSAEDLDRLLLEMVDRKARELSAQEQETLDS